jgi:hypothetical protein
MGLISDIARSAGIAVYQSGPTELVSSVDLAKFLDTVRSRGICVSGLEGFRIVGDRLVPDMDAIADFSSIATSGDCEGTVAEALRFLSDVGEPELLFEVMLNEAGRS